MVQFVQGNIGTSVDLPFAGPSTIVGATGQYLEFVNYVQQAYKALQLDQDNWLWRIKPMQLALTAQQNFYTESQIRAQIPDYEIIIHMHFIDDTRYGLIAQNQTGPSATTTNGAVTSHVDTYTVPVHAIGTYQPFDPVLITDGSNSIAGPIQSVNTTVGTMSFAAEQVTVVGTATSIANGAAVTYTGTFPPGNFGNQTFCFYIEYQNWRGWKDRNVLPNSKPTFYTRCPDGSLEFNPVPDVTYSPYVFYTDYRVSIDVLDTSSDTSTPANLPTRYHEIIPWRAVMYWAMTRRKGDVYAAANIEYTRILGNMYREQLPDLNVYLMEAYG